MKLVVAVVQDKFANKLVRNFLKEDIRITKLSSTGGFLKKGNSTFIIGVVDKDLDRTKDIIKSSVESEVLEDSSNSENINVKGAHVFILNTKANISV